MPYYGQGDYYAAGDPGLLSAIGGLAKRVGASAAGFLVGGPLGAARGAINPGSVFGQSPGSPRLPSLPAPSAIPGPAMQAMGMAVTGVSGARSLPATVDGIPPKGYHLNKSGYHLKSGEYVPPRSRYVRNRTRNPANGRALRRAVSRVTSFERLVKRSRKSLRSLAKV